MREIKFRAWDTLDKKWYEPTHRAYEGRLFELVVSMSGDLCAHVMNGMEHQSVWPEGKYVLMQYIGLKDKNEKEIYESDIVRLTYKKEEEVGTIVWGNGSYLIDAATPGKTAFGMGAQHYCEVIGNIYENEDLLTPDTPAPFGEGQED